MILPWIRFDVGRWMADTVGMTATEEAGYLRLVMALWVSPTPGVLPNDDRVLARVTRMGTMWKRVAPAIRAKAELTENETKIGLPWLTDLLNDQQRVKASYVQRGKQARSNASGPGASKKLKLS